MNKLIGTLAVMGVVAGFVVAEDRKDGGTRPADDKATSLVGTYTVVSGEKDGKPLPKEGFEGAVVKITDKTMVGTDKDKKEFYSASYTLDTSKTPWTITMTTTAHGTTARKDDKKDKEERKDGDKGEKPATETMNASGLVKVDGDTLTIIYALPGGKAPTEFKTGEKQQMFVLKRMEAKKEK